MMLCPRKAGGAFCSDVHVMCGMLLHFPVWDSIPGCFSLPPWTGGCCIREDGVLGACGKHITVHFLRQQGKLSHRVFA